MKRKMFLKTGEFARLCHTTKETLFHYDRKGLLKPKHVTDNGYRCYGVEQYFDFDLISLLKETGSTLGDIRIHRETSDPEAWLRLLRDRTEILRREQARLDRRAAMLSKLVTLTEEALVAPRDRLTFATRAAERVILSFADTDKLLSSEGVIECYAACAELDLARGNTTDPPLGTVIPEQSVLRGELRPCALFTRAEASASPEAARELPGGRYAVLFHRGDMVSQARAFQRMIASIGEAGLRTVGDAYAYDQMSYLLDGDWRSFTAKYVVRVD